MDQQKNREDNKQEQAQADIELTDEQTEQIKAGGSHGSGVGAGKVSMQDFHFVMKNN